MEGSVEVRAGDGRDEEETRRGRETGDGDRKQGRDISAYTASYASLSKGVPAVF